MMADRVLPGSAAQPIARDPFSIGIARRLTRFRDDRLARFPGRIRRLFLFGSQARGEATADFAEALSTLAHLLIGSLV